jgi:hypothetical protein
MPLAYIFIFFDRLGFWDLDFGVSCERERAARINLVGEGCGSTNGDRGIFLYYTYIIDQSYLIDTII